MLLPAQQRPAAGGRGRSSASVSASPTRHARRVPQVPHDERAAHSGPLHQVERELSGVMQPDYHGRLLRVIREAAAVLVVNPLQEAMISPYTDRVQVVTSRPSIQPASPGPGPRNRVRLSPPGMKTILFAGLVEELMKGFMVLQEACRLLWKKRQDFELIATSDPVGNPASVHTPARLAGTNGPPDGSQPAADIVVTQPWPKKLSVARPWKRWESAGQWSQAASVGCRSQSSTASHRLALRTRRCCRPGPQTGNAPGRSRPPRTPGATGRRRFEEHYTWPVIIEKHYRPLLVPRRVGIAS